MSLPEPDKYVQKLIELYGGRENLFTTMGKQHREILSI